MSHWAIELKVMGIASKGFPKEEEITNSLREKTIGNGRFWKGENR